MDYFIPNLSLSDVICHMFYISQPSRLLETIIQRPPHILVQKAANERLIAKAVVTVTDLKQESQTEYFQSNAQLLAKDDEVLGTMNLLLKFTDLGIPPSDENSEFLKSVIEYKENVRIPETLSSETTADIFSGLQQLFGIHEKLRDTYYKINEGFLSYTGKLQKECEKVKDTKQGNQKKKQAVDDKKKAKQLSAKSKSGIEILKKIFQKEKSKVKDSETPTETKSQTIVGTKEPSSKTAIEFEEKHISLEDLSKLDVNTKQSDRKPLPDQIKTDTKHKRSQSAKQIAIQTVKPITRDKPKQTPYTSKPSAVTKKQQCQKCGKYFETDFGQQIWQDNELVFWCKDCNIKHLQAELKETAQSCTERIIGVRDYVKNLDSEYAKYRANTVSKEEYERLAAAQHNLTMMYYHAQEQNNRLRTQCAEMVTRLEESGYHYHPQITDQVVKKDEKPIDSPTTINELLQEIYSFRCKDLLIQGDMIEKAEEELLQKMKAWKSESNLTSSRRRDRCEACRIIQNRSKTAPLKTNKSGQSRSTFPLKFTENKLSLSTSQQTPYWIKYNTEESTESTTSLTGMCVHDIREKIDKIQEKIHHYIEERNELIRTYHYTSENPLVSYTTKSINKFFNEWNELKRELNKHSQ